MIPINAMIQIRVAQGEKKYECMAAVVDVKENGLYLSPIKHEGQIIDFSAKNIQIFVFYVNEHRQVYGWSGCRIKKDIYQKKLCHLLTTNRDSVRVNRRGEPRIRTDMHASLRTISDDKEWEIIVRNYSEHGIGFVCAKPIPQKSWGPITIIYEDRVQQMRIVLHALILRGIVLSENSYKYGALLQQPDDSWIEYVRNKLAALKERNVADGSQGVNT